MIWVIFFCPWGFVCYSQGVGCCCTNDGGSGLGLTHTVGPLVSFEGLPESTGSEYLKLWSVFGRFLKKACIGKSSVLLWSFFQLIEVRNWGLFFFTLNPSSNISSDTTRSATKRYRSVSWGYGGKINYVFIHWESMGSGLTDGFRWSMSRGSNKSPTTSLLLTFLLWHSAPIAGVALFRSNSLPISTSPSPITPRPKDPESLADPVWCRFGHLSRKAWRTRVFFFITRGFFIKGISFSTCVISNQHPLTNGGKENGEFVRKSGDDKIDLDADHLRRSAGCLQIGNGSWYTFLSVLPTSITYPGLVITVVWICPNVRCPIYVLWPTGHALKTFLLLI